MVHYEQAEVKFAPQLAPDILEAMRQMSAQEGRNLQAILDETLRAYIEEKQDLKPRWHVLGALQASMAEHDSLYKTLSK